MRTTLKLILPLIVSVLVVSLLFAAYQVRTERRMLRNDLSRRAEILAESLQENAEPQFDKQLPDKSLQRLVDRFGQREHLKGVAIYNANGIALAMTSGLASLFQVRPAAAAYAAERNLGFGEFLRINDTPIHVYALPLHRNAQIVGTLALVHDVAYIDRQVGHTLRDSLVNALVQTVFIAGLALILVRWTLTGPLTRTAKWLRTLRTGQSHAPPSLPEGELFDQLHHEVTHLARDLNAARASAEEEARLRDSNVSLWTAERLRVSLSNKLQNKPLFVIANREPYMHVRGNGSNNGHLQVIVPASGLVTALEPVLLATDGTWIAHGSGNADRETVDAKDHLRVPPERPTYTLRRVWLSAEEEKGYYEGFANEGIWPLCHIAHTRPIFRPEDWIAYQEVNRRFADAAIEEMQSTESPIVLVQDYHFALLPRMIKEARPDARVAIFWHIPWPNPEVFGICPWQRELIDGLLGADLIGFHIQSHCNNFLSTVDRAVEALTEWDRFSVNRQGHVTRVRPYPISVGLPENGRSLHPRSMSEECAAICNELSISATLLGVGVDRVDYTKGILERLRGIELFFELYPSYQRRFTFIQIGAPSRTNIERYQRLLDEVSAEAERINARFQAGRWKPIVFLKRHHSHDEIARFYHAASLCMVTSLHDGMNLVAKEFVASREDNRGVLILSTFAGAALELTDALLVNPYDVQQLAGSIHRGLNMPDDEQAARMQHMRGSVREHNVYRWAASLLSDLTEIRIDTPERVESSETIAR